MKQSKIDVIIFGAGPSGVTASGALAGTGLCFALLCSRAGVYAPARRIGLGTSILPRALLQKTVSVPGLLRRRPPKGVRGRISNAGFRI